MHQYRALSVMAIDSGRGAPHISLEMRTGLSVEESCTAYKMIYMEQMDELRDMLGWASVAYLTAADELHEDGWKFRHGKGCPDLKGESTDEA